jgi:hypothetical protein
VPEAPIKLNAQQRKVLKFLLTGQRITPLYALQRGVQRLGARIWDLKKVGVPIRSAMVKVKKETDEKFVMVKSYWLERSDINYWQSYLLSVAARNILASRGKKSDIVSPPPPAGKGLLIPDVDIPITRYR